MLLAVVSLQAMRMCTSLRPSCVTACAPTSIIACLPANSLPAIDTCLTTSVLSTAFGCCVPADDAYVRKLASYLQSEKQNCHVTGCCVPADDAYVRKLAAFLRDSLRPDVKVFVEHSNEVWNQAFPQVRDRDLLLLLLKYPV
jgi:hypothetical protein